jgi:hypothetical protein
MKVIPSVLISFSVLLFTPNVLSQSVRSSDFNTLSTTSSDDLIGVEPRTLNDWNWGLGGELPDPQPPTPLDSTSLNLDIYETKLENLNNTYDTLDYQLGDYHRPTHRFPFAEL